MRGEKKREVKRKRRISWRKRKRGGEQRGGGGEGGSRYYLTSPVFAGGRPVRLSFHLTHKHEKGGAWGDAAFGLIFFARSTVRMTGI